MRKTLPLTRLLHQPVHNREGTRLGWVRDVAISPKQGRVETVILRIASSGESREACVEIPWSQLTTADDGLELDISRSVLHRAFGLGGSEEQA